MTTDAPSTAAELAASESAASEESVAEEESAGRTVWTVWTRWRLPAWLRGWRRTAAAAVIAVLVLGSGGLLFAAQELKDPAASGNHALTDTAATDQVIGDVSSALSRIFAYTPTDTESTARAARDVLAGTAATQYQKLFAQIRQNVAAQQLTLTTRVVRAGVVTLTAHHARLVVFLDQTAQRAGSTATSAAAQLSVTADHQGTRWRITALKSR
jgi:Mce-associated membrane protein